MTVLFIWPFQALEQTITDHEPELVSLKKEAKKLCEGPTSESDYLTKLSQLTLETEPTDRATSRPGKEELEGTLTDFTSRLEALRNKLQASTTDLNSQLDQAKMFQDVLQGLLSWVTEAEGKLDGLKVRNPSSAAIEEQRQKCQVDPFPALLIMM